jgi:hypothetical protein
MINKILSIFLALNFLLPSLVIPLQPAFAKTTSNEDFRPEKSCKDGKCADRLTGLLEAKSLEAKRIGCFPPANIKKISEWYQNHPLSIECFKLLKEIEELIAKVKKVEIYLKDLDEKGTCKSCDKGQSPISDIVSNLEDLDKANAQVTCSEKKKKEIWNNCGKDALCVLVASSIDTLGPIANKIIPASIAGKGCKNGQDSCLTQLATGFIKSVFGLFEGLWDLLKGAGKLVKKGITNAWNWVWGAEEKSSTSQLAAAKASENEGVFQMLRKDFGGTMSKIWSALVGSLKEWLASSVFCQEWSGTPQFSKCLRPAQGFDCTSCKAMITGVCSISGTIIAEIIPAFLTGGLVSAAKYGAQGASKIIKTFKISSKALKTIKASKVSKLINPITKVTKVVKASKAVNLVADAIKISLTTIKNVMLKPIVNSAKISLEAIKTVGKTAKAYLVVGPTGTFVSFSAKALKTTGKVLIFPFENAMTKKAYELGEASMVKLVKGMKPTVIHSVRPVVTAEVSKSLNVMDEAFGHLKVAKMEGETKAIAEAEEKYLKTVIDHRGKVVDNYLKSAKNNKLSDVLDDLFPELNYGKFKDLKSDDILKAEDELLEAIQKMPSGPEKERLALEYQDHVASRLRKNVLFNRQTFSRDEVLENASLSHSQKVKKIAEVLKKSPSASQEKKILKAVEESEKIGKGVLLYTSEDLAKQKYLLKNSGLTNQEVDQVIKSGLTGKLQIQDQFEHLKKVIVPKSDGLLVDMSQRPEYRKIISGFGQETRVSYAKAMKTMEEGGMAPAEVTNTLKKFEKNFDQVQKLAGSDTDAASMLAEYIRREKAAGLSDQMIKAKLEKAFGACK